MKAIGLWCGVVLGTLALAGTARAVPETLAYDEAGNYTPATFVNGANGGTGFGAWDLWNVAADLGDSTAGGGGDLNSTNGYSFRFMSAGDSTNSWCNGRRNFAEALKPGDVLSFTFTYNWCGGQRGVDVFSAGGQFANLINVADGDVFQVNGQTISSNYSPGAVVEVEITQQADGIQLYLSRSVGGVSNLAYVTNVVHGEGATGVSMYCGGYSNAPENNVNYAIFMNDLQIVGEEPTRLTFTGGTWNPAATGDYPFELTRSGEVGDEIVLTSDNEAAATVPASATFVSNQVSFDVTVVSLTAGPATIVASNEATGVWTDYVITPVPPALSIGGSWELFALGPAAYTLQRVGAVGDTVALSSSVPGVLTVPATATFATGETQTTFNATAVAFGSATILASNAASGAWATFDVTVAAPALALSGPTNVWTGATKVYAVARNSEAGVGATVNLSSSDTNALAVPATVEFAAGQNRAYFLATSLAAGAATITADNDDVEPAMLDVAVADMPGILASDEAGNYTPATFVNGANLGTGFGAWDLWNVAADLGDSTAGGGGDLNSTNGYSFRFMSAGDSTNSWCNGRRNFAEALKPGDVLSFTFTYNWCGGQRGVDVFSAGGQFANLINVADGDVFQVNGQTVSTNYSPGAVVEVEITQQADGIQLYLTRSVAGVPNLVYVTNVVHGEGATGVSMYCGGYSDAPENNVNYAIFMNDLRIVGEEPTRLTFTGGTWNPAAVGAYPFELTRSGEVGDEIVLTSDNEAAAIVPASATFVSNQVSFDVTVVSLTAGNAKIVASNVASGAWAEYDVYPVAPMLSIGGPWLLEGLVATNYTLTRSASVGTNVLLSSSDTNVLWVPAGLDYDDGVLEAFFPATALAYGTATIVATDVVSGAWAEYNVTVQPSALPIPDITFSPATHNFSFAEPAGYDLYAVYGADCALANGDWAWSNLVENVDYTNDLGQITILTAGGGRQVIRVGFVPE